MKLRTETKEIVWGLGLGTALALGVTLIFVCTGCAHATTDYKSTGWAYQFLKIRGGQ